MDLRRFQLEHSEGFEVLHCHLRDYRPATYR